MEQPGQELVPRVDAIIADRGLMYYFTALAPCIDFYLSCKPAPQNSIHIPSAIAVCLILFFAVSEKLKETFEEI